MGEDHVLPLKAGGHPQPPPRRSACVTHHHVQQEVAPAVGPKSQCLAPGCSVLGQGCHGAILQVVQVCWWVPDEGKALLAIKVCMLT